MKQPEDLQPPNHSGSQPPQPKSMRGRYSTIITNTLILILPLLLLSLVLIGLVFHRRVRHNVVYDGLFQTQMTQDESWVLYVNINPTYLMKVASLSSTVATSLASFAVILAAYPLAKNMIRKTQNVEHDKLLTPYQYYLCLGLVEGASVTAIYRWLMDSIRHRGHQKATHSHLLANIGRTAVITMILGALVFGAETWFHFGTTPYNFSQVSSASGSYNNNLPVNCSTSDNTSGSQNEVPCSIYPDIRGGRLVNPLPSLEVLGNISKTMSVNIFNGISPPQAFLGIPGNGGPLNQDFQARTYSASTQCTPVTTECGMSRDSLTNGVSVPFTCPQYPAFSGNLISNSFSVRYFADSSGALNDTFAVPGNGTNPFFFGVNGYTDRAAGVSDGLQNDPEVVMLEFGGIAYIFFCNSTIFDTTYTAINGSVTNFDTSPSNYSVANMIQLATTVTGTGYPKLKETATLGALSSSAQEMADSLAIVFSQAMIALVAGAMQSGPAFAVQQRSEMIVSRIPIAALILLVVAIFLLVAWGVFLSVVALVAARTKDIEEVRARLTLQYLVAERSNPERAHVPVENLDEMFEEKGGLRQRVGVTQCETEWPRGWELKVWNTELSRQ